MGKFLLGFASACLLGPGTAAIFEPVFFGIAAAFGWAAPNVEKASQEMTSYIFGEYLPYSLAIMAFGLGVWSHWIIGKPRRSVDKTRNEATYGSINVGENLTAIAPVAIGHHNTIVQNSKRIFRGTDADKISEILPKDRPLDFKIPTNDSEAESYAAQIYRAMKERGYMFKYDTFVSGDDFSGGGGRIGILVEEDYSQILIGGKDSPAKDFRVGLGGMATRNVRLD